MGMAWLEALPELVLKCIFGYVDDSATILRWSHTNRHFFTTFFRLHNDVVTTPPPYQGLWL
jgi:hypothetical protein